MSKNISVAYQPDGSVICNGGVDPQRTATYAGPKNSAGQLANVAAFYALEPDVAGALTAAPSRGTVTAIFTLDNANMNTTADQAFTPTFSFSKYIVTAVIVTGATSPLALAVGGIYAAASKSGAIIVPAVQAYASLSTATQLLNPTLGAAGQVILNNGAFLSLTIPQGSASTADFLIMGIAR